MTMHLAHPALSTTGKRKGKLKFKSADAKREYERLNQEWLDIKKRHGVEEEERKRKRALSAGTLSYKLSAPPGRESTAHIPSRGSNDHSGSTAPVHKVYTGTKVLGIATMHKSNAVPVFAEEEAVEISRMRRG